MDKLPVLNTYEDFVDAVETLGFVPLSHNAMGLPSLESLCPHAWFTDLDTDPWSWKTRLVNERKAIYAKLLDKKPVFFSKAWYPYIYTVRRQHCSFEDLYLDGVMNQATKKIYTMMEKAHAMPIQAIISGFTKDERSRCESAITALQMHAFLVTVGMERRISQSGAPYGWHCAVFMRPEDALSPEVLDSMDMMDADEALVTLMDRALTLSPAMDPERMKRYIIEA